eukprot:TRINITY_DN69899_c0_g1_i1.p1 TRINITY_DN69899_c0_g1~~TRINITY_DN69899_c0_g1_i1.p1  ORF type:complete len:649 (-),score=94.82 TRINITY_DN69899_c0_g1_i1:117-1979(-)
MPETSITDAKVPLPWEQAAPFVNACKQKAAQQFISLWKAHKDRVDTELRWGEEIEYMLIDFEGDSVARVALCADEILRRLGPETGGENPAMGAGWRTEYGNMMVEGVTYPPFTWSLEDVLQIEPALAWRRSELERVAAEVCPTVKVVTLSAFPFLGVSGATSPHFHPRPHGEVSQSSLCPEEATSPHPRYSTFTANYRKRKGCKVGAFIPREGISDHQRLTDKQISLLPFELKKQRDGLQKGHEEDRDPVPGHIWMDSQAFGACQCCTQATFLARNLDDARYLTDQFLVLAPIFLALTASTPFLRGLTAETDTRWEAFQQTWDDRREDELAIIRNSRTSPCDLFIGAELLEDAEAEKLTNDVEVAVHQPAMDTLLAGGLDPLLSKHVAHILARDPLMVFEDRMDIDDAVEADHWEQLQGTNWNNVRFKPPPCKGDIGWRVEFRSPEVQLTDFENAAICGVIRILAEVIIEERWDLRLPVSRCNENDKTSAIRNAASVGLFWFRGSVDGGGVRQRLLADILSSEGGVFQRCRAWIHQRQEGGRCSPEVADRLSAYISLFEGRARGDLPTPAAFMREMLSNHAGYDGSGVLPASFVYELCTFAAGVNSPGAEWPTKLLGHQP